MFPDKKKNVATEAERAALLEEEKRLKAVVPQKAKEAFGSHFRLRCTLDYGRASTFLLREMIPQKKKHLVCKQPA